MFRHAIFLLTCASCGNIPGTGPRELSGQLHPAVSYAESSITLSNLLRSVEIWGKIPAEMELRLAALNGDKKTAKWLMAKGADVNMVAKNAFTPLYYAVMSRDKEMIQLLLSRGAYLETKNHHGFTALHLVTQMPEPDVAELLLEAGANTNAIDINGDTPLHHACRRNDLGTRRGLDLLESLVFWGADPRVLNNRRQSPFKLILKNKNILNISQKFVMSVCTLLEVGADISSLYDQMILLGYMGKYWRPMNVIENGTFSDFDEYIMLLVKDYETYWPKDLSSQYDIHVKPDKRLKSVEVVKASIQTYRQHKLYALYRFFKNACQYPFVKEIPWKCKKQTSLEFMKFTFQDILTTEFIQDTYLMKLPLEVTTDVLYFTVYGWKIERLAWNAALATRQSEADVEEVKTLMRNLWKESYVRKFKIKGKAKIKPKLCEFYDKYGNPCYKRIIPYL